MRCQSQTPWTSCSADRHARSAGPADRQVFANQELAAGQRDGAVTPKLIVSPEVALAIESRSEPGRYRQTRYSDCCRKSRHALKTAIARNDAKIRSIICVRWASQITYRLRMRPLI